MKSPPDQYIKIGTTNTRYWVTGSQGQPTILIHGLGGYVESWLPNLDVLATQHHVYALDLPGHGRTDKPADFSYKTADFAQFVRDFMAALHIESAHVVGHSLGGAISARLALKYPKVVDKLVLVASAGLGKEGSPALRMTSVPVLGEILTRPSRSGSADAAKLVVHDPAVMTPELVELDYQMASQPGAQSAVLRALRANGNVFGQHRSMYAPNVQGMTSIMKPVLVVWGRQDQLIPVAHVEVAAKGFPNVRVHIFEKCGHLPMLEHPSAFNELLLDFLSL